MVVLIESPNSVQNRRSPRWIDRRIINLVEDLTFGIRLFLLSALILSGAITTAAGQGFEQETEILHLPPEIAVTPFDYRISGQILRGNAIEVNRFWLKKTLPILPIIFFDTPGSSEIPPRYHRSEVVWSPDSSIVLKTEESPIEIYRHILNVIGNRMRFSDDEIVLTGSYSSDPGESVEVAIARAEAVKSELTTRFGIAPRRISIGSPIAPSTSDDTPSLREEARSVLMEFRYGAILDPVEYAVPVLPPPIIPTMIAVSPNMPAELISRFRLSATYAGRTVGTVEIPKEIDTSHYLLHAVWSLPSTFTDMANLTIEATVIDIHGKERTSNAAVITLRMKNSSTTIFPSQQYYMLWNFVPVSAYQFSSDRLIADDLFEWHVAQTTSTERTITVNVPVEPADVKTYDDRTWSDRCIQFGRGLPTTSMGSVVARSGMGIEGKLVDAEDEEYTFVNGLEALDESRQITVDTWWHDQIQEISESMPREIGDMMTVEGGETKMHFPEVVESQTGVRRGAQIVETVINFLTTERIAKEADTTDGLPAINTRVIPRAPHNLFPPDTPEERCYNRSVQILVR